METLRTGGAAAVTGALTPRRRLPGIPSRTIAMAERGGYDALLVAALAAMAGVFLIESPGAFQVDSWLALVAGREVWQSGIPHHDLLAVITHGGAWVDQQWLSQLATYTLYRIGGLGLVGLVNVGLIVSGLVGSAYAARRLGARARTLITLLPLCAWLVLPSGEVRTQAFAFPLFVTVVYLLASDSRHPSRRVYWCLPLLVLWANLHGSASLGAGLVALRGLTLAWERRNALRTDRRAWLRPLALTIGGPACLLITPYGTSVVAYYHATLLNSALKHAVTEWQPITSSVLIAAPFFVLLAIAVWSFGRYGARTTLWERAAVIALGIGAIDAIRNVSFFALTAWIVVSVSVDAALIARFSGEVRLRPRVNRALAYGTVLVLAAASIGTLFRPARAFQSSRLERVLSAVAPVAAANPSLHVLADQWTADWLLWKDPGLRGRVAYDVRFELLSAATLGRLQQLYMASGPDWKQDARGYRLLVLDAKDALPSTKEFLAEPGARILYDDGRYAVILRTAAAAG